MNIKGKTCENYANPQAAFALRKMGRVHRSTGKNGAILLKNEEIANEIYIRAGQERLKVLEELTAIFLKKG